MKLSRKGFTLIELLAVIVVLAIIALVATPLILGVVEKAKKGAAESSALSWVNAVENQIAINLVDTDDTNNIPDGVITVSDLLSTYGVSIKGKIPASSGTTTITNGKVTALNVEIDGYSVTYDPATGKATAGGSSSNETPSTPSTPVTYATYNPGDLVYFDPVSTETCDSTHTTSETCYKWRVIAVDDDNTKNSITVQMDHDIVNFTTWSPSSNTTGPTTALSDLETATSGWTRLPGITYSYDTSAATSNYGALTCTNGACKIGSGENFTTSLKARMITGEEIRAITMATGAASGTSADNWTVASLYADSFYFSNSSKVLGTQTNGTGSTTLAWLIENTTTYADSGATANTYGTTNNGYWTLSPASFDSGYVWYVNYFGNLSVTSVNIVSSFGVRPVITISKSQISS